MDWSKAKNILILALIATNIFLIFTYFSKSENDNEISDREVLFSVLEGKNIFIETEIPDEFENMPAITIEYKNDKQEIIEENLKLDIYKIKADSSEEVYREMANKFLRNCQISDENLLFDSVITVDNNTVVKYKNCYKEIVIGDSFIEVTFVEGEIKDITRQILTAKPKSKKKLKVISPEEALLMFMSEKKVDELIHIEKMQLVFWVNDSNFDGEALISDTAFPAWEITYNNGIVKYIDAYKA